MALIGTDDQSPLGYKICSSPSLKTEAVDTNSGFEDAKNISTKYRNACAEDSTTSDDYYLISVVWMDKFLSFASGSSSSFDFNNGVSDHLPSSDEKKIESHGSNGNDMDENNPGRIYNHILLEGLHMHVLKQGLSHGKEYALVGQSAWKVLSTEFGFDYEIRRKTTVLPNGKRAVQVYPKDVIGQGSSVMKIVPLPLGSQWDIPDDMRTRNGTSNIISPQLSNSNGHNGTSTSFESSGQQSYERNQNTSIVVSSTTPQPEDLNVESIPARKKTRKMGRCGLTNLGNTCFMNSTLQCLAHSTPLRNYFMSEEYMKDLNKSNPLGTGGDLAIEFSKLLQQMWGNTQSSSPVYSYDRLYSDNTHVVSPQSFKYTLGRHASQFMGYDQHDSQEFATYLLDALHEDTNLVTKKPYVEKTEQKEGEADEIAAKRAWQEYLVRDNSKVVHSFMGQVKSKIECTTPSCGRVSTTFDPFMFLSVPIPGSQDRTIVVTFVPLDPEKKMFKVKVVLTKTASILSLKEKIGLKLGGIKKEDICLADIWKNEIYSVLNDSRDLSVIKDSDEIYAFHLESKVKESSDFDRTMGLDGSITIEVHFKNNASFNNASNQNRYSSMHTSERLFASPIMLRIPANLTVYGLRNLIGKRLEKAIALDNINEFLDNFEKVQLDGNACTAVNNSNSSSSMDEADPDLTPTTNNDNSSNDSENDGDEIMTSQTDAVSPTDYLPATSSSIDGDKSIGTRVMRSIPLVWGKKKQYSNSLSEEPLGCLTTNDSRTKFASPKNLLEGRAVSEVLSDGSRVTLQWPSELIDCFNKNIWNSVVSLEPTEFPSTSIVKKITLQDCIASYCQKEQLEDTEKWYCNKCKDHVRAWKQFHLYSTAPILIIQLKRFQYTMSTHRREKISTHVDFPVKNLDLRETVMTWKENEEPIYDCYAVSNHYGGLGGGHYTAYAKNNGSWFYFDDSRVSEVKDENEVISSAAYVLFYRRRDISDWDVYPPTPTSIRPASPMSTSVSSSPPPLSPLEPEQNDSRALVLVNNTEVEMNDDSDNNVSPSDGGIFDTDDHDVQVSEKTNVTPCSSPIGSIDSGNEKSNQQHSKSSFVSKDEVSSMKRSMEESEF